MDVRPVSTDRERAAVRRLYPLYLHDLSEWSSHYALDEAGVWQPSYVDDFLGRPDCAAYLIRIGGAAAGFAWVGAGDFPRKRADRDYRLAEFFVAAPFRRRGVGASAAAAVISDRSGSWQLEVVDGNDRALRFWRRVLGDRGPVREEPGDGDLVFLFDT